MNPAVSPETLHSLREFDTCTMANAIECFGVRLLNEGFTNAALSCRTPGMPVMVGAAFTLRVRSADPPMKKGSYLNHPDWWERLGVQDSPHPRILVIEDVDHHPGRGSLVGAFHACILKALGFVGVVSNGAVRGLGTFEDIGLSAFSGDVSPSHAYGHAVADGVAVEVAGLRVEPGDILHGDRHGILSVPASLAEGLPDVARRLHEREKRVHRFCLSPGFSPAKLRRFIETDSGSV